MSEEEETSELAESQAGQRRVQRVSGGSSESVEGRASQAVPGALEYSRIAPTQIARAPAFQAATTREY